ncbi:hypothetical protein LNQ49_09905 [Flavobacterium sp. F-65]|jgi:hypothetical protein|uniref:SMI1/KNR4 family protein n=1 Tax=Flavobacterium pisciphilum TaxID=2893755 RepID=A0ABS8MTA3_9FLAO|nr:hypothetical protein [Flavobacterium sp. F-65]MCC9071893.1 hypothetical protein [Flavobacterium sp. F-65]
MNDFSIIKKLFHIVEPNGFTNDEIQIVKDIFGELPQVFIDYYTELGKIQSLNQTQDLLIIPERFQYYKHNNYLIFYSENQKACVWGIHKDDLSKPNPPVFMSTDEKEWNLETETLMDFFTAMAFLQASYALEFTCDSFSELEQHELNFISKNFKNKGISLKQWLEGISFYGNYDDDVIVIMSNYQLFYSANTKEHFIEMDKVLSKLGTEF